MNLFCIYLKLLISNEMTYSSWRRLVEIPFYSKRQIVKVSFYFFSLSNFLFNLICLRSNNIFVHRSKPLYKLVMKNISKILTYFDAVVLLIGINMNGLQIR